MMVGILGILKAGGAYVPIDPEYPQDRISYMLEDTGAALIVSSKSGREKLTGTATVIELDAEWEEIEKEKAGNPQTDISPEQLAYVIYTSGSTGRPKGVMIEHKSVVNLLTGISNEVGFTSSSCLLSVTTYSFDICYLELYMPLINGARLVIVSRTTASDGFLLKESLSDYCPTHMQGTPSTWQLLADANWGNEEGVKMLIGGEAVKEGIKEYLTGMGDAWNVYGPTETTIWSTIKKLAASEKITIGKPLQNTQVYILRDDQGLSPVGVTGEICIGGDGLARGYRNRTELTAKKFIKDSFSKEPGARLYKTGDLGRWLPDGDIECLGRIDDQVKIRGYRIELGEIESVLNQSEQVRQGVVLAKEDGGGNMRLVGYVIPEGALDKQAIQGYLRSKLPDYMVPSLWLELEQIPLTPNGKIDRKALPDAELKSMTVEYVLPRNETEAKLAEVWQDLLGIARVGTYDNFFELGGHSLLAMRVASAVRRELNVELTIKDLFVYPDIASLGAYIEDQSKELLQPAMVAVERPAYIPLSFSQERLWFIDRLGGSVQYHLPAVLRLKGSLNREILEKTLRAVINRHEVLRTVILEHDGQGYQQIIGADSWALGISEELTGGTEDLTQLISNLITKPFDLSADYMLRADLIRLDVNEHILVVTMHHIASDGWSISVLVKEVIELYASYVEKRPAELPVNKIQYADYAVWQRQYMRGEVLENKLGYWKKKLEDVLPLHLPADYGRPQVQSSRGDRRSFNIEKELSARLQTLSQQQGVTLYMTMLAAFKVLLYRYSGQEDICIGTPMAGRGHHELGELMGFFVNTLALRSRLRGDMPFSELLQAIKDTTLEAYVHQEVPFEKVVEAVVKERDMNRNSLFQVVFTFQNTPEVPELRLGELSLTEEAVNHTTSTVDMVLYITETNAGIDGTVEYCTDLYKGGTIERMISHYINILASIAVSTDKQIGLLSMLNNEEEEQLLLEFNDTAVEYSTDKSIIDLFEDQVIKHPETIAVVFGQDKLTYNELNARSNQLAQYLQFQGVRAETLVPICIERSMEMIVGILGVLKSGGAYVPIDPDYPADRIGYMLEDTGAELVLSSSRSREKLNAGISVIELDSDWDMISRQFSTDFVSKAAPDNLAYVIYTSGSTGKPKGVMIEHGGVVNLSLSQSYALRLKPGTRTLQFASFGFDASCYEIFNTFLSGGCLVLCNKEDILSAQRFKELVDKHQIEVAVIPPSFQLTIDNNTLGILRTIVSAGEPLNKTTGMHIQSQGVRLINAYGPTETTVCASLSDDPIRADNIITIGKPIWNTQIYILNTEKELSPIGVMGEMYVGGAGLARGYLNRAELTAEKFIADPFSKETGARLYRTGDLGRRLPDGNIEYLGRTDDQVKIRGYRIELGEIESVLNESELISQGVVLAKEDTKGNKRLIGYVVPSEMFNKEVIQGYLASRLPEYMIPALWVELEQLPLTPNGKIDRKVLPDPELTNVVTGYTAPRNATEEALAGIWQELLDLDHIGIYDNFFELGGDSILMIQVLSRMRRLGHVIPKDIFNYQEIASISDAIERGISNAPEEQRVLSGPFGLVPIQSWYLQREQADVSHFNQSVLLKIDKKITAEVLQAALDSLMLQHDALRLLFEKNTGVWRQEYGSAQTKLYVEDLQHVTEDILTEEISVCADKHQRSLSIEQGRLLQMVLMQTPGGAEANRLLIVIHHLGVDGVSWRILLSDLEHLLDGLQSGKKVPLGAKGSSYRQWYSALEQYGVSHRLLGQKPYWKQIVSSYKPLPLDHEYACEALMKDMRDYRVRLGADQTRYLLQEVPKAYHTEINDLLLSALAAALCGWIGESQVIVALEGHGREAISTEIDSSGTVGWFTSLYPVLLKAGSDAGKQIKGIKETLRQVPDKGLGYGVLKYLGKSEELQGRDPWDLVFNYLGQLDTAIGSGRWLNAGTEPVGSEISEEQLSASKLSVNSYMFGGELILRWSYSSKHYNQETISKLAGEYILHLTRFINHCMEQGESGTVYTPSDYGLGAEITYQELDRFIEGTYGDKGIKDEIESMYRLSGLQQGMLFHGLYNSHGSYIEQLCCDLVGVNLDALLASWSEVISHHSILRSAFYYDSFSIPVQCVYRKVKLPVAELDYRGMGAAAQQVALKAYETADRTNGFDFKSPPLMRLALIRLDKSRYRMLWTSHHLLFDGWSMQVLMEEFLKTYENLISGQRLEAVMEDRYEDYIRYLERRDKAAEEQYWRGYLKGISQGTLLPFITTTKERTKGKGEYGSLSLKLDCLTTTRVQGYAQSQRLTVNTLVQGVWAWLLHHYTDSDEVMFGVVVSGRPDELPDVERRVGMYINTLVFKAAFNEGQDRLNWLQGLQADQVSSRQYQYTALRDVLGWVGVQGDLFDSLLVFENYPISKLVASRSWSLQVENIEVAEETNYPLTLTISGSEELEINFSYNTELLEQGYITAIRDQFEQVLLQMTDGNAGTLRDVRLLTTEQEHVLLTEFNSTAADYPKDKNIVELFEKQAARNPRSMALVFENQELSYGELDRRSNQLAHYLQKNGVMAETLVPICIERSLEMIIGILGILKAGGAYVPIDPAYPEDRISYMLEDTGAKLVLSNEVNRKKLKATISVTVIALDGDRKEIEKEKASNPKIGISPSQLGYVIYTSGSTGRPKGVMIEHRSLVNLVTWHNQAYEVGETSRTTSMAGVGFDAFGWEIWPYLAAGACIFVIDDETRLSASVLSGLFINKEITHSFISTAMVPDFVDRSRHKAGTLKYLLTGGDKLSVLSLEGISYTIVNNYGPTENTVVATSCIVSQKYSTPPIGKPVSNTRIYILNREKELSPVGVSGEICIGGAGLARGYLNRAELTAEKFISDPFSTDSAESYLDRGEASTRLYKTGDLGRWLPDGNIEYLGRIDDQVKIRGYRIELGEIESLLNESGQVSRAVVLAKSDSNGNKRLVGYVVPQGTFDKQKIQNYLRMKLPDYMVPALWIELEQLPLTPNGKIDRKALPDPDMADMVKTYTAPRNETEAKLAGIWQELLGVERVGIYDNFFELGGHSLLVMRAVYLIQKELLVSIPVHMLFQFTSISDLSKYFEIQTISTLEEKNADEFDIVNF
jgi:amino acid adenylation domain-containing protein/non-ribosomal peptide synthase protein (TIGR01720 family)